jgi:cell division protein FtsL
MTEYTREYIGEAAKMFFFMCFVVIFICTVIHVAVIKQDLTTAQYDIMRLEHKVDNLQSTCPGTP